MIRTIDPAEAKALVHAGEEIAFLDLREAGQFGKGHPLFAVPCPYSRLETLAASLVPNRDVPVLLIDAGDGVSDRAAGHLSALGFHDLAIVAGGAPGWQAAGYTLFKGVNVPSKMLGELAEHEWQPQQVDALTLQKWQAAGQATLFDGRPPAEYAKMHVPGAVCMPNGELAYRVDALAGTHDRNVIVGCAGRTRGIIGAIGLELMGCPAPVFAMRNGTQGWALAGLDLERGVEADHLPPLDDAARIAGRKRAAAFAERWEIPVASAATVRAFLGDVSRTTVVFDVRSGVEAAADPLRCARHAPSGHIVQATDQYVGVRHARIVLCDDVGIRAGIAAFWLRQLGFEPFIALLDGDLRALPAPDGPPAAASGSISRIAAVPALEKLRANEARLFDLRSSRSFRRNHVEGAVWATRARLDRVVSTAGPTPILLVADDDDIVRGVARDLRGMGVEDVAVVEGGHAALVDQGGHQIASPDDPSDADAIDFLDFVHDRHDGNLESSRRYLDWETGLIAQLDADERRAFRLARNPDRA